jgi:hypothetical protein
MVARASSVLVVSKPADFHLPAIASYGGLPPWRLIDSRNYAHEYHFRSSKVCILGGIDKVEP